jgi:hypothetical protein
VTSSPSAAGLPIAAGIAADVTDADDNQSGGPTVGASDADADAARAGAAVDLDDATRDSDGVPVGRADAEADAGRTEGDGGQA